MIELYTIEEDIFEKDFPKYINTKGYECIRLINKNSAKIKRVLNKLMTEHDYKIGWLIKDIKELYFQELFKTGSPDFIIYNTSSFYLCEFKSKNDGLSNVQIYWLHKHKTWPLLIAYCMASDEQPLYDSNIY
jgi:hypothetical protein